MVKEKVIRQVNDGGNTWIDCSLEAFNRAKENGIPVREVCLREESFRAAFDVWQDKTDWVQNDRRFEVLKPWGMHRADVLKAYIEHLESRTVAVKQGEVLVTVAGFTGCGKSAIAGEIEIAMKAIGVPVTWANGDSEKRMTGADWLTAIEMYNPTVRIVEVNIPRPAGIKVEADSLDADGSNINQPGMVVAVHIDVGDFVKFRGQVFEVKETDFDDHDVTLWFVCGEALKCAAGCQIEVVSAPVEDE